MKLIITLNNNIMKRFKTIILVAFILNLFGFQSYGQCQPDTLCVDDGEPGQICPDSLPDGLEMVDYYQIVTIFPPPTIEYEGNTITLSHLRLDTINNVPPGLTYESNAEGNLFAVGSYYCVLISGIPDSVGVFPLSIEVQPYILGFPVPTTIVDDTSLSITINSQFGIEPVVKQKFFVDKVSPNPFPTYSTIYYSSPKNGLAEIYIIDKLGREIYSEQSEVMSGENSFNIDGSDLQTGMYFYFIRFDNNIFSGKLVKVE